MEALIRFLEEAIEFTFEEAIEFTFEEQGKPRKFLTLQCLNCSNCSNLGLRKTELMMAYTLKKKSRAYNTLPKTPQPQLDTPSVTKLFNCFDFH